MAINTHLFLLLLLPFSLSSSAHRLHLSLHTIAIFVNTSVLRCIKKFEIIYRTKTWQLFFFSLQSIFNACCGNSNVLWFFLSLDFAFINVKVFFSVFFFKNKVNTLENTVTDSINRRLRYVKT